MWVLYLLNHLYSSNAGGGWGGSKGMMTKPISQFLKGIFQRAKSMLNTECPAQYPCVLNKWDLFLTLKSIYLSHQ